MQVKEIEEFIKQQQEQLQVNAKIEKAKIEGFSQGAAVALNTVESYMAQRQKEEETKKAEKAAEKASDKK